MKRSILPGLHKIADHPLDIACNRFSISSEPVSYDADIGVTQEALQPVANPCLTRKSRVGLELEVPADWRLTTSLCMLTHDDGGAARSGWFDYEDFASRERPSGRTIIEINIGRRRSWSNSDERVLYAHFALAHAQTEARSSGRALGVPHFNGKIVPPTASSLTGRAVSSPVETLSTIPLGKSPAETRYNSGSVPPDALRDWL